jgi:hypothetical protein
VTHVPRRGAAILAIAAIGGLVAPVPAFAMSTTDSALTASTVSTEDPALAVPAEASAVGAAAMEVTAPATATRPHPHRRPWPVTLTVQTVPSLSGVRLSFDGATLITDAAGRAHYPEEHNFAPHRLTLLTTAVDGPDRRYRFARWAGQRDPDQAFRPALTGLPMRANYTVTAAFSVQYPVQASFVDQVGRPLDLTRVSSVRVKSDTGELFDLPTSGPIWVAAQTPSYRGSAMVENDVSYSLQSITMNGTNIVDAGRQRFRPSTATAVTFVGQLHTMSVGAMDAVYRRSVGASAVVTYPDGTARTVPFGPDHTATLSGLPRGTYTVSVRGAQGVVLSQQVGLSRDRVLSVGVLTVGDLFTILAIAIALAAALLFVGRLRRHTAALLRRGVTWVRLRRWREAATG